MKNGLEIDEYDFSKIKALLTKKSQEFPALQGGDELRSDNKLS
jgi:hypothetical protein